MAKGIHVISGGPPLVPKSNGDAPLETGRYVVRDKRGDVIRLTPQAELPPPPPPREGPPQPPQPQPMMRPARERHIEMLERARPVRPDVRPPTAEELADPKRPKMPPCQCKERAEALKRAAVAKLASDQATWDKEMEFVKRSIAEDGAKMKQWASEMATYQAGRIKNFWRR